MALDEVIEDIRDEVAFSLILLVRGNGPSLRAYDCLEETKIPNFFTQERITLCPSIGPGLIRWKIAFPR